MNKTAYRLFSVILTCFLLWTMPVVSLAQSGPADQPSNLTVLEELSAVLHRNGSLVEVKGAIKNISSVVLHGFVTVYLLDASGKVINSTDEAVGTGGEFVPGATAEFEVTMKVPRRASIDTVSVDFVRD